MYIAVIAYLNITSSNQTNPYFIINEKKIGE
jgi:hypothetical protein